MITLQRFDDKFTDYYDREQEAYIIYAGRKDANCFDIEITTQIKDFDGYLWNCWLFKAEYIPQLDCYELTYKAN